MGNINQDKGRAKILINDNISAITMDEFEFILYSLNSHSDIPITKITLAGAEPLEHPHFLDMIKKIDELGMTINIATNAVNIDLSLIYELQKLKAVEVTLVSGEKSSEQCLYKMELLKMEGIEANIIQLS